ncbi:MAG: tail fiber domain-containing protein, partial [Candidatus Zixiibacteriota bacterium]
LSPRTRLTSVGYAYRAEQADTAAYAQQSAAADSDWTIDGSNMYSAVSGNVGIGTSTPATKLDVVGDININSVYRIGGKAVLSSDPDSGNILVGVGAGGNATKLKSTTFVGDSAGYNNQSGGNTFVGRKAGYSNTEGGANTFLGNAAGLYNQSGDHNTFLGGIAGLDNTTGSSNTFVGSNAGISNTEANSNTFVGVEAGLMNTTGSDNVYIGRMAGCQLDTASCSVIIGSKAGPGPGAGSNNVFIGFGTGDQNTGSGNVFIGYEAGRDEHGSNKLYIANGRSNDNVLISGNFSTGNVAMPNLNSGMLGQKVLWWDDTLYVESSSRRYKENIRELNIDASLIFQLDPVRFDWKKTGEEDIGLIAEDVDQVIPDLVIYDGEGKPESVKYDKVAIYLLEVVKELKAENEELKKRMEALESKE